MLFVMAVWTAQTTDDARADLFRRINDVRAKGKVQPLVRNKKLDSAAQKHAENMAKQDKFGDEGKNGHIMDGKDPRQRLDAEGYEKFTSVGENVAFWGGRQSGPAPTESAVQMWVKSEEHYKNIMNEKFDETGVGVAQGASGKWYFCQTFGKSGGKK
jgi:uncharacterized protein YkwD